MAIALVNDDTNFVVFGTTVPSNATALTAGNLNAVHVAWRNTASLTVSGVVDVAGNTYLPCTRVENFDGGTHYLGGQWWYAYNCLGHATNVVTATLSDAVSDYAVLTTDEFSGAMTAADPLDTEASANGDSSTGTLTSSSFTTNQADEVILARAQQHNSPTHTAGSGYTLINATNGDEYKVVSSIQTGVTTDLGTDQTTQYVFNVVTFKAPAVAGLAVPVAMRHYRQRHT